MRQPGLGDKLQDLLALDFNRRVTIFRQADDDTSDAPPWTDDVAKDVEVLIIEMTPRDRAAKANYYVDPVTHTGFMLANDQLATGFRLVETHAKDERGRWHPIEEERQQSYLVRNIGRVPGVPEPNTQIQLDLWQMNEQRMQAEV